MNNLDNFEKALIFFTASVCLVALAHNIFKGGQRTEKAIRQGYNDWLAEFMTIRTAMQHTDKKVSYELLWYYYTHNFTPEEAVNDFMEHDNLEKEKQAN